MAETVCATVPYASPRSPGFQRMFRRDRLTLGLFFAIESYTADVPTMADQIRLAKRAEEGGFAALWTRDVPLRDPSFGDVGQIYDPWVWMGYVTAQTTSIALATGSIVLPLHHPLDIAKAAASVDNLSDGRLVLGVASGDRPIEFPAYGLDIEDRDESFRDSLAYFNAVLNSHFPVVKSRRGVLQGGDLLPKPLYDNRIPIGITGNSRQSVDWIAANADVWIMYPRAPQMQQRVIQDWKDAVERAGQTEFKPFAQSLYIDLADDPHAAPTPIHLGFRLGREALIQYLGILQQIGVNHVAINLKYGKRPAGQVVDELCRDVLPHFPVLALPAKTID